MNSSRYSLSEVAQKLFGLLWEEMTSSVSLDLQPELNILLLDSDLHIGGVSTHLDLCNLLRLKTQSGLREAEILEFKKIKLPRENSIFCTSCFFFLYSSAAVEVLSVMMHIVWEELSPRIHADRLYL